MSNNKNLTDIEKEFFSDIENEYLKEGNLPLDISFEDIEKDANDLSEEEIDMEAGKVKLASSSLFTNKFFRQGFKDGLKDKLPEWLPTALSMSFGIG